MKEEKKTLFDYAADRRGEDASEVFPNVFISSLSTSKNKPFLKSLGITHILPVGFGFKAVFPEDFKYLVLGDIADNPSACIIRVFEQSSAFISQGVLQGKVLVHCQMGMSRSGAVVAAFLMKCHSLRLKEALRTLRQRRPCVKPNKGFMEQLREYDVQIFGAQASPVSSPVESPLEITSPTVCKVDSEGASIPINGVANRTHFSTSVGPTVRVPTTPTSYDNAATREEHTDWVRNDSASANRCLSMTSDEVKIATLHKQATRGSPKELNLHGDIVGNRRAGNASATREATRSPVAMVAMRPSECAASRPRSSTTPSSPRSRCGASSSRSQSAIVPTSPSTLRVSPSTNIAPRSRSPLLATSASPTSATRRSPLLATPSSPVMGTRSRSPKLATPASPTSTRTRSPMLATPSSPASLKVAPQTQSVASHAPQA